MKKLLTLTLLLCATLLTAQEQSYTEWQEIDTLIAKGHYTSAYEKGEQLFKDAQRKGDGHDMLRAAYLQHKAEIHFQEDVTSRALARYKGIAPLLSGVDRAVSCMFVANIYKEYYERYSYRIDRRTTTGRPSEDYTQWSKQTFADTIAHYYALALQERELLRQCPVEQYDILIKGDEEGRELRPTLYDVVIYNIITHPTAIEQSEESRLFMLFMANDSLYGSSRLFARMSLPHSTQPYIRQLQLLQELVIAHEGSSASLRTQLDLLRMEYITRAYPLYSKEAYTNCLEQLAEEYKEIPGCAAEFLYRLASQFRHEDATRAVTYLERALATAPDSEAGKQCKYLYNQLTQPEIKVSMNEWVLPDEPTFAHIEYRNTAQLYFKIVSCGIMANEYDVKRDYAHMRPIRSWMREVKCPDKHTTQEILTNIAPLPEGSYGLLVSTGENFELEKEHIAFVRFNVSSLGLVVARDHHEQELRGFVINRKDGRKVTDCKVSLQKESNRQTTLIEEYTLDKDGAFTVPFLAPNDWDTYYIVASDGKSMAMKHLWSIHRQREGNSSVRRTALYTDRYTYRPGETVQFNLIGYDMSATSQNVLPGEKATLKLTQFRLEKPLQEVEGTTDEYGCFYGQMTLPADTRPGSYYLEASLGEERFRHTINIEAFKAPTFIASLDTPQETVRFGDSIIVRGRAVTFTGMPLGHVEVHYQVKQSRAYLFRHYGNTYITPFVAAGNVQTDEAGNFIIPFTAVHYGGYNDHDTYTYRVTANITDESGETQTCETAFVVGHRTRQLSATVPEVMIPGSSLLYTMTTLNGAPIEDSLRLRITRLKVPQTDRLPSLLNNKMKHAEVPISEKSFLKLHPHVGLYPTFDKSMWEEECVCLDTPIKSSSSGETCYTPGDLKDGVYKVEFSYTDGTIEETATHYFTQIHEQTAAVPDLELLFVHNPQKEITKGEYVNLLVGTHYTDVIAHYIIEQGYRIVDMGELTLSKQLSRLPIHADATSSDPITVRLVTIKENIAAEKEVVYQVVPREDLLHVKASTFRDYLEPGQEEECTLTITDASGNPVQAAATIAVYDAALDKYGANEWSFPTRGIKQMRQQLYESGLSGNYSAYGPSIPYYQRQNPRYYLLPIASEAEEEIFQCIEDGNVKTMSAKGRGVAQSNSIGLDAPATVEEAETEQSGEVVTGYSPKDNNDSYLRTNLNHTALFLPNLRTDKQGQVTFTVTAPDLLTQWHVKGIAHTKDLKHGRVGFDFVTRKTLMVQPHVPRFLYEGDKCDFTAKVSNSGNESIEAVVKLKIDNEEYSKTVSVEANGSTAVSFPIIAPAKKNYLTYSITVESLRYSDGEQAKIAVLPRRTLATETMALYTNGTEKREFVFDALKDNHSETLEHKSLTLDIVSNPIWYAIEALPPLCKEENPSNERLFHRYYAATMGSYLIDRYPEVEGYSDFYRRDSLATLRQELLNRLATSQSTDGGWAWMNGFDSDRYTTLLIIKGLGELEAMGCISIAQNDTLYTMVKRGIGFLDANYHDSYIRMKRKPTTLDSYALYYLYTRSMFPEMPFGDTPSIAYDHYKKLLLADKATKGTLMQKAMKMLTLIRLTEQSKAAAIAEVVRQSSLSSDEMGVYWRDNTYGWSWDSNPIATQALLIEAFAQLNQPTDIIGRMQQWLLKQKQTTEWSNSIATAQAVHALVGASPHPLPKRGLSNSAESMKIKVGGKPLTSAMSTVPLFIEGRAEQSEAEGVAFGPFGRRTTFPSEARSKNLGIIKRQWAPNEISPSLARVSIEKQTPGISWGSMTWQYYEDADKVKASGTGLTLKCTYYKVENREGKEILTALPALSLFKGDEPEGRRGYSFESFTALHKGDRIRVRLQFTADRAMDYVELHLQRPAALEPTSTRSGYTYSNGIGYYRSIENTQTKFYFYRLNKGEYFIDCDLWVSQSGNYTCGVSTIQCMYAPEFVATAEGTRIAIEGTLNRE